MPIPDYQTLMLPVLRLAAEKELGVPEAEEKIVAAFGLTQQERDQLLPSGKQRVLSNRIHWAKQYLSKAGLLDLPDRGRFIASSTGHALLAQKPAHINKKLLLQYPAFAAFVSGASETNDSKAGFGTVQVKEAVESETTPEEQIELAHAELKNALRAELLQRILRSSPSFFEQVIIDLLVAMGYGGSRRDAATQIGRTGDGGVDGVINEDRLGLDRLYIQAKRYAQSNSVGRPDVQAFVGSLVGLGATKGVFVTTSTFSAQATTFVKPLTQRVVLIDGQSLADLMIEHNIGVRTHRAIEFKRIDEDFFSDEE